jgi:hypothetical protein
VSPCNLSHFFTHKFHIDFHSVTYNTHNESYQNRNGKISRIGQPNGGSSGHVQQRLITINTALQFRSLSNISYREFGSGRFLNQCEQNTLCFSAVRCIRNYLEHCPILGMFGRFLSIFSDTSMNLKVGCLHPVACTRSGSGFPSNATLVRIFYSVTATCFGLMTTWTWRPWIFFSYNVYTVHKLVPTGSLRKIEYRSFQHYIFIHVSSAQSGKYFFLFTIWISNQNLHSIS